MLCVLATEAHEFPILTSLISLYFSAIDFKVNFCLWTTCNILPMSCNQSTHTVKRLYNLLEKVFVFFQSKMHLWIQTFFVSYLENYCIEVSLNQSFLLMGLKKLVPLSERPTYPGSQLSKVFWFNLVRKFKRCQLAKVPLIQRLT